MMLEFSQSPSTASANSMLSLLNINMEAVSRQNFLLGGNPPLAALHSIAEIKASSFGQYCCSSPIPPFGKTAALAPASSSTPHGINDILSRPTLTSTPTIESLTATLPRFNLGINPGMYFSSANSGVHKLGLGEIASRPTQIYWPSVNPLWKDRGGAPEVANRNCGDKDEKKKHTRPTFSGHQIYVLEKTFEQTKYLAGPERAKLAFALGMSESQVKVWFQNRRTKWRKKHAAEMATAKQKHDSAVEYYHQDDLLEREDFESKRLKRFKKLVPP